MRLSFYFRLPVFTGAEYHREKRYIEYGLGRSHRHCEYHLSDPKDGNTNCSVVPAAFRGIQYEASNSIA